MQNPMQRIYDEYTSLVNELNVLFDKYSPAEPGTSQRREYISERLWLLETFARTVGEITNQWIDDINTPLII